jgi:hypothetical protein
MNPHMSLKIANLRPSQTRSIFPRHLKNVYVGKQRRQKKEKKKRKSKEKVPSVGTSKQWQEYHTKKLDDKRKKEFEKEQRKRKREEKSSSTKNIA